MNELSFYKSIAISSIINKIPFIRSLAKYRYEKLFTQEQDHILFRGVFDTYLEAKNSAPSTKVIGFDNDKPARYYINRLEEFWAFDYPVVSWLNKLLKDKSIIFDYGGNIGNLYYTYKKYVTYPKAMQWICYDVEQVLRIGKQIATERNEKKLFFTDTFQKVAIADIFLASGSLQYVEENLLSTILSGGEPNHIIINKIPLSKNDDFFSLQNMGTAFCPYHIFNKDHFIKNIEKLGYTMQDSWIVHDVKCKIPFHPKYSLNSTSGLYFSKQS